MNYKLEKEINRAKRKVLEDQYKNVRHQINELQKLSDKIVEDYGLLLDEAQRLAEDNDAKSVEFIND